MQIGGTYIIDFAKVSKIPKFNVTIKSGDRKRTIKLILLKNNEVLNLNNYTVVVTAKKCDGKDIFNDVKIIDAINGICEVEVTEQMLALNMDLPCEIVLYDANGVVASSSNFVISKISSLKNEETIVSSSEFTALTKALSDILYVKSDLNKKRNKGEKIKSSDLDTSSDDNKIKEVNLSEEVKKMMAGNTPIHFEVQDGGVTSNKYANNSISLRKLKLNALFSKYLNVPNDIKYLTTDYKMLEIGSPAYNNVSIERLSLNGELPIEGNFIQTTTVQPHDGGVALGLNWYPNKNDIKAGDTINFVFFSDVQPEDLHRFSYFGGLAWNMSKGNLKATSDNCIYKFENGWNIYHVYHTFVQEDLADNARIESLLLKVAPASSYPTIVFKIASPAVYVLKEGQFCNPLDALYNLSNREVISNIYKQINENLTFSSNELENHKQEVQERSYYSQNAGILPIKEGNVFPYRSVCSLEELGNSKYRLTKIVGDSGNWYGLHIRLRYERIEELKGLFSFNIKTISGQTPNTSYIVKGKTDWGPASQPIKIDINNPFFNIYEKIMSSTHDKIEYYSNAKELYFVLAFYNSEPVIINNKESVWELEPTLIYSNAKVCATNITNDLETNIINKSSEKAIEEIKKILPDIYSNKYITCWGDSLTAGGGWTTTLQSLTGLTVYNGGTGGENSKTIMARQGGDIMTINNITIPATTEPVTIATRSGDGGILTYFGNKVTPLLQGGTHVNPCYIEGIKGTLKWTGSGHSDPNGTWTFTRLDVGEELVINRPTAIRTDFDINKNSPQIMIIFMGQNGGYDNVDYLIQQHRLMIEHSKCEDFIVLGLSSGTASSRKEYEDAMRKEFGRRFISLREYLSQYGLEDAGIEATEQDISMMSQGQTPQSLLVDSVHYNNSCKTVIGNMIYKKIKELNMI